MLNRCVSGHCKVCQTGICCGACRINCECTAVSSMRSASLCSLNFYKLFGFGSWKRGNRGCQENPNALFQNALQYLKRHPGILQYMRHVEVICIDELATAPLALMQATNLLWQHIKQNSFFFGNVLVVATADGYQNEPINDKSVFEDGFLLQYFKCLSLNHLVRCQCSIMEEATFAIRKPQLTDSQVNTVCESLRMCHSVTTSTLPAHVPIIVGRRTNLATLTEKRLNLKRQTCFKSCAKDYRSRATQAAQPTQFKTSRIAGQGHTHCVRRTLCYRWSGNGKTESF